MQTKSGYVDIEPLERLEGRENTLGTYDGDPVKVGVREEVRGEGSDQELHVFISGLYRVFWNKPHDKVRVEEKEQ